MDDLDLIDELANGLSQEENETAEERGEGGEEDAAAAVRPAQRGEKTDAEGEDSGLPDDFLDRIAPDDAPKKETAESQTEKPDDDIEHALSSDEPPSADKASKTWKYLKDKNKELDEKLRKTASELEELRKRQESAADAERLAELEKRLAEKDEILAKKDLEASDYFREKHDTPIMEKYTRAVRMAMQTGEFGSDAEAARKGAEAVVRKALEMPVRDRQRYLMDELPELQGPLGTLMFEIDERRATRAEELKNWKAASAAARETQTRMAQSQTVKQVEDNLGKSFDALVSEGNFYFEKSKGDSPKSKAWNDAVEERKLAVKHLLLTNKHDEVTKYVADGFTARLLRAELAQALKETKRLKAQLKDSEVVRPSVSSRPSPAPNVSPRVQNASVRDLVEELASGL